MCIRIVGGVCATVGMVVIISGGGVRMSRDAI
jgi:hypothetical protein